MKSNMQRVIPRLLLMTFFLLTTTSSLLFRAVPVVAEEGDKGAQVAPTIRDAVAPLITAGATVSYHSQTGRVNFIGTLPDKAIASLRPLPVGATREDAAR